MTPRERELTTRLNRLIEAAEIVLISPSVQWGNAKSFRGGLDSACAEARDYLNARCPQCDQPMPKDGE